MVDEAQDHDTAFEDASLGGFGWWSWYFAQLREGTGSPISIFLDIAQRPDFRSPEQFSLENLLSALPGHTRIQLDRVLRYTRPIYNYLYQIDHEAAQAFKSLKLPETDLPTGPEILYQDSTENAAAAIEKILDHWIGSKLCRIDDIVILGPRRNLAGTRLSEQTTIKGYPLTDYAVNAPRGQLRYLGIHRAKGLDFLAVILLDTPTDLLFPAATRTRQLLAVVKEPKR